MLPGPPRLLFLCGFHSATRPSNLQFSVCMMCLYGINYCSSVSCNTSMSFFIPIFVPALEPIQPPMQWVPEVKIPKREADHSPTSTIPPPPTCFYSIVLN
jgi:hypothetical protein